MKHVLAFDIGGTKIRAAVIDPECRIVEEKKEPIQLSDGPVGFVTQIKTIGDELLKNTPHVATVGIACAGPLDPTSGVLTDPTNLKTGGKNWGIVEITKPLSDHFRLPIKLENDAAAGAIAEYWKMEQENKMQHREQHREPLGNFAVLTLGTGLGVGVFANHKLVRAGRGLHPEASHIVLDSRDESALCGCGNFGCAEAYLSGAGFVKRANQKHGVKFTAEEWIQRAKSHDPAALDSFQEYSLWLSQYLQGLCVLYAPEEIVFTGSFAGASEFFFDVARSDLKNRLRERTALHDYLPRFTHSKLANDACLIGAARIAFGS